MKVDVPNSSAYLACGFLAYYLRYGNQWQGNEIRLAYNILFGVLNLIGWVLECVWAALPSGWAVLGWLACLAAAVFFMWLCNWFGLFSERRYF